MQRIIIKYNPDSKSWSPIYLVTDTGCESAGFIFEPVFEKLKSEMALKEIDSVEIIELFFKHVSLISDVKSCKYFEIKNIK